MITLPQYTYFPIFLSPSTYQYHVAFASFEDFSDVHLVFLSSVYQSVYHPRLVYREVPQKILPPLLSCPYSVAPADDGIPVTVVFVPISQLNATKIKNNF